MGGQRDREERSGRRPQTTHRTRSGGPGSDVDLAVSGLPPERFFDAMAKAEDALDGELDLVDLDEPSPFTRYLREEGELQLVG